MYCMEEVIVDMQVSICFIYMLYIIYSIYFIDSKNNFFSQIPKNCEPGEEIEQNFTKLSNSPLSAVTKPVYPHLCTFPQNFRLYLYTKLDKYRCNKH